jgi:hypothetical protein
MPNECPDLAAERLNAGSDGAPQSGATLLMAGVIEGDFDDNDEHFQLLQSKGDGVACQIGQDGRLPKTWILLDNQSTVDVFYVQPRPCLQTFVLDTGSMDIHCNAGVASTNLIGELPGYGTVWYHPSGIREYPIPLQDEGTWRQGDSMIVTMETDSQYTRTTERHVSPGIGTGTCTTWTLTTTKAKATSKLLATEVDNGATVMVNTVSGKPYYR